MYVKTDRQQSPAFPFSLVSIRITAIADQAPRSQCDRRFWDHLEMRSIECDRLFQIATCPSHFGIPKGLCHRRDPAQARDHLDQATALFREMEMTWWLEQAEALGKRLELD